jgi:hypothetical protein
LEEKPDLLPVQLCQYQEGFFVLNSKHKTRKISVLEVRNKFNYEIFENKKLIEGEFTAQVSVQEQGSFPRNQICPKKYECVDIAEHDNEDKDGDEKIRLSRKCHWLTECKGLNANNSWLNNGSGRVALLTFFDYIKSAAILSKVNRKSITFSVLVVGDHLKNLTRNINFHCSLCAITYEVSCQSQGNSV